MINDIDDRFDFHPPSSDEVTNAHEQARQKCKELADWINETLPDGRDKSSAITSLEVTMFWTNAGIARTQLKKVEPPKITLA